MNTIVMFKKFGYEDVKDTNNMVVVNSSKSLEEFKEMFNNSVAAFVAKIRDMNVGVNEANSKMTEEDYASEEMTDNMLVFSELYNKMEEFKKENFVFEFEGQYIDMKKWFWNDEFFYEYEIYYLEDFVKMKLAETKVVPEYSF